MPANTNYNDPYTISRVISIIQDMNPTLNIGDYESHVLGENIQVKLTNGTIIVKTVAIEDVDFAYEVERYSDFMVSTFKPDDN